MKLAIDERNVATNLGTTPGCVIEYCFYSFSINNACVHDNSMRLQTDTISPRSYVEGSNKNRSMT